MHIINKFLVSLKFIKIGLGFDVICWRISCVLIKNNFKLAFLNNTKLFVEIFFLEINYLWRF